jgi:hypothetical protein
VNDFGLLLGGRLKYAEAFLPEHQLPSDSSAQPVLVSWQHAGYQLILDVPLVPLTGPSYNGPPEPRAHTVSAGRLPGCAGGVPPGSYRLQPLLNREASQRGRLLVRGARSSDLMRKAGKRCYRRRPGCRRAVR